MERVEKNLRERLVKGGYVSVADLPNVPDRSHWVDAKNDCNFTGAELNRVVNALFPAPGVGAASLNFVAFRVQAFEQNFPLSGEFLSTPLPERVPLCSYVGYQNSDMDMNAFDRNISNEIARWMDGKYGDGEEGIISRNDALFSIYVHLAGLSKFSRNKHEDSTVLTTRSNRTDNYEGVTLVKIEEKDDSLQEAIHDLVRKAHWLPLYSRLPFIFGIAVTSDQLEIFTLHSDNSMFKVFYARLTDLVDRWLCVKAMINIARTLKLFIEQKMIIRSLKFDVWHKRNNKRIRLDINFAEVEFNSVHVFNRMRGFYTATAGVPNLEHLYIGPELCPFSEEKKRVRLVPVGVERKPDTLDELIAAVKQISTCLFSLHAVRYVHCDVRWNNIVQVFGQWFLIDCEYACHLDEHELLAARSTTTIKKSFVMDESKPWSPLFDLYQIGLLLTDSGIALNEELAQLRELLMSKNFSASVVQRVLTKL